MLYNIIIVKVKEMLIMVKPEKLIYVKRYKGYIIFTDKDGEYYLLNESDDMDMSLLIDCNTTKEVMNFIDEIAK